MIDLRSDTVTRPSETMRRAMANAPVGDDGYGDDPTVNALERKAARMLGKEAALLVPSGTMGNLCAVLAQAGRGEEVIVESTAHVYRAEQGGIATLGGIPFRVLTGEGGAIPLDVLRAGLALQGYTTPLRPVLLCLETSHNASGGKVLSTDYLAAASTLAKANGIAVHIDGARLFNASVALEVEAEEIARHADTVTFCLSKGLGAPAGSLLCGPKPAIQRARVIRKMLGGTMRQAGVLAAAGLVALDSMIGRLADDHRRAKRLAEALARLPGDACDNHTVQTNIVLVDVSTTGASAHDWSVALEERGILCRPTDATRLRLLTHLDVSDQDIDAVAAAFADNWARVSISLYDFSAKRMITER